MGFPPAISPESGKVDVPPHEESLRAVEYYPWIDVLRAFCFFMVFFNHFGVHFNLWFYPQVSRGGVSLFFVISGWLITKIVLKALARPDFLTYFYSRRLLRIYPAYYLTTIIYIGICLVWTSPSFVSALPGFLTFNYSLFPGKSDLFSHAWSIAVEERFYVLWPLLCVLGARFRIPIGIILGVLLLFMTDSIFAIPQVEPPSWAPFLPASLLYGCFLALYGNAIKPLKNAFLQVALAIFCMGCFLIAGKVVGSMYHPGVSLFALAIVWCCSTFPFHLPRLFSPVAKLGELSYGMYLIHMFPLLLMGTLLEPVVGQISGVLWLPVFTTVLALVILIAYIMHRLVEKPILDLRYILGDKPRTALVMACIQIAMIPVGILYWLFTR